MPPALATSVRPRVRLTEQVWELGVRLATYAGRGPRSLTRPGTDANVRRADLPRGTHLGPYRVIRVIGRGGMSVVYEGRHTRRTERVALKVAKRDDPDDPQCRERLFLESLVLERLHHSGIPALRDLGVLEDGRAWIAIDLLDGYTLTERLTRRPILVDEACDLLGAIASALGAAHACGVVHRDLKPDNIVIARTGRPSCGVIDWGIARTRHLPEARITEVGVVSGTPLYMSPEQARGREVDGACDVYSLGVIAYEMLCGAPPFDGDSGVDILVKHINDVPRRPSELRGDLPGWLVNLVLAMLSKRPGDRPSTATIVAALVGPPSARELERVLAELDGEPSPESRG